MVLGPITWLGALSVAAGPAPRPSGPITCAPVETARISVDPTGRLASQAHTFRDFGGHLAVDADGTTTTERSADQGGSDPFPDLEAALDHVATLPYPRNVTIAIAAPGDSHAATLRLTRGVALTSSHSCVTILGEAVGPGQDHIRADTPIPAHTVLPVTDPTTLKRIQPSARGQVYRVDFAALNVSNFGRWPETYDVGDPSTTTAKLFYNGTRLDFSRYPKVGQNMSRAFPGVECETRPGCTGSVPVKAVLQGSSKQWLANASSHKTPGKFQVFPSDPAEGWDLARWTTAVDHGLYLEGNWRVDFVVSGGRVKEIDVEEGTVTFVAPMSNGLGWKYSKSESGCGCEPFHVRNALEAITEPLEYALDWGDNALYVMLPRGSGSNGDPRGLLTVADMAAPLITLDSAQHARVHALSAGFTLGRGIYANGGSGIEVAGCRLHDIDADAVTLVGVTQSRVHGCDIESIGAGGVEVSAGGDVKNLISGGNSVTNNHIWNIGLNGIAEGQGVRVINGSVGLVVAHNRIHHIAGKGIHLGVFTSSNAAIHQATDIPGHYMSLVEYNEVFAAGLNGSGFSAIYSCCDPAHAAGGVYRYNFVHSSPAINGIGWDNMLSGQTGYGNVLFDLQNGFGLNHGSFNSMHDNLIIKNSPRGGITSFQYDAAISIACSGFSDVYNCSMPFWTERNGPGPFMEAVGVKTPGSPWNKAFGWYLADICDEVATRDGRNQNVLGNSARANVIVQNNAAIFIDAAILAKGCTDNTTTTPVYSLPLNSTVDPGFANYSGLNFTLLPSSPIFAALPAFVPPPFGEMGLEVDAWRREIPQRWLP